MARCWPVVNIEFSEVPPPGEWAVFSSMVGELVGFAGLEELGDGPMDPGDKITKARVFFEAVECTPEEAAVRAAQLAESVQGLLVDWLPTGAATARVAGEAIPDADWGVAWRQYFRLLRVGQRIYCGPPWDATLPADAPADAIVVKIDPGQAFGTGTHETTQLCLRVMEEAVRPGARVFDVGAGSGILSFAAILLGGGFAWGMEFDPVAEDNFHLNAKLNGVQEQVAFVLSGKPDEALAMAGNPALDLIVCNMLSTRFLPLLAGLRAPGATMVLSGFLLTEEQEVRDATALHRFTVKSRHELGEWGALICEPV